MQTKEQECGKKKNGVGESPTVHSPGSGMNFKGYPMAKKTVVLGVCRKGAYRSLEPPFNNKGVPNIAFPHVNEQGVIKAPKHILSPSFKKINK